MTSSYFQIVNPQDAIFMSKYPLASGITAPRNGKLVHLEAGELADATHTSLPLGFLWGTMKLVPSTTANYPTSNSNSLTAMAGLVTGVCRKAITICDGSYFVAGDTTGDALADGDLVSSDSGGLIKQAVGNIGAGKYLGRQTDQYGNKRYMIAWDFTIATDIA